MKIITTGKTRFVILINRKAIKIPYLTRRLRTFVSGIRSNRVERTIWKQTMDEHLFPVLFSSSTGLFLVMPQAEKYCIGDAKQYLPGYKFLGDDESCNYGYLNGKICKLDYGEAKLSSLQESLNDTKSV